LSFIHRMYRQPKHIPPTFLTNPTTSLLNNFKLPLISDLIPSLFHTMLLDANRKNLASYWHSEKSVTRPIFFYLTNLHLSARLARPVFLFPTTRSHFQKISTCSLQLFLSHLSPLPLCNLLPPFSELRSFVAISSSPPQAIIVAPPHTIIVRRLPYTGRSF
jgi:hypothetical protein